MIRVLCDENLHGEIIKGLLRTLPDLDLVRVQDCGLRSADDPSVLDSAASRERIVISHDARTLPRFAYDRVSRGLPMPGVFIVDSEMSIGTAISELSFAIQYGLDDEWTGRVIYFPL